MIVKERCDAFSGTGSEKPIRSAEFDATVIEVNLNKTDKGEVQFERAGDSDRNTVGAYYLPWGGMFVMSMNLPADAASDFFFTAGLAGCSVFASGAATEPTIYHAGTEGKYAGDVAVFWEECIKAAASKQGFSDLGSLKGINKNNYMNDPQVEKFEKWLKSEVDTRLKVEHASPGGFVFGLRCNKEWEFYLQDRLAVVAKHGHPLFIALPLDEALLRHGVHVALAIKLFQEGVLSLGRVVKLAGLDYEAFVEWLGSLGIPAVGYAPRNRIGNWRRLSGTVAAGAGPLIVFGRVGQIDCALRRQPYSSRHRSSYPFERQP